MVTVTMVNKFKTEYVKKWMKIPEMEMLEIKLYFPKIFTCILLITGHN